MKQLLISIILLTTQSLYADSQIVAQMKLFCDELTTINPTYWDLTRIIPERISYPINSLTQLETLQVTVKEGDHYQQCENLSENANCFPSERSEITEKTHYMLQTPLWYELNFFIAEDFPITNKRLVLVQVKQSGNNCPLFALRYVKGKLYITRSNDEGKTEMWSTNGLVLGRWHKLKMHFYFSKMNEGLIETWLDDEKIISQDHIVTAFQNDASETYLKFGLYRDTMKETMDIQFANYCQGDQLKQ